MENEIKLTLEQAPPQAPTLTLEGAEPEQPEAAVEPFRGVGLRTSNQ